jgi:hypothetical protein
MPDHLPSKAHGTGYPEGITQRMPSRKLWMITDLLCQRLVGTVVRQERMKMLLLRRISAKLAFPALMNRALGIKTSKD